MSAAVLAGLPSGYRVGTADNSFALFPPRLAGKKLRRREIAERYEERAYFRQGPAGKLAAEAPIARIIARDPERTPERGVSA
jgi:hypothetical protein